MIIYKWICLYYICVYYIYIITLIYIYIGLEDADEIDEDLDDSFYIPKITLPSYVTTTSSTANNTVVDDLTSLVNELSVK